MRVLTFLCACHHRYAGFFCLMTSRLFLTSFLVAAGFSFSSYSQEISWEIENPATLTEDELPPGSDKAMMPQLDISTYPAQIFWLVVFFFVLYMVMVRFSLPAIRNVLQDRHNKIHIDLEKAEALTKKAREAEADFTHLLAAAKQQSTELVDRARSQVYAEEEQQQAQLTAHIHHHMHTAEKKLADLEARAIDHFLPVVTQSAMLCVQKFTGHSVDAKEAEKIALAISRKYYR